METFTKKSCNLFKKNSFLSPFYVQIYYGELLKFNGKSKSYYAV